MNEERKALFREGIARIMDVEMTLETNSMFGREDALVTDLRSGIARVMFATRHLRIWPLPAPFMCDTCGHSSTCHHPLTSKCTWKECTCEMVEGDLL